MMHSKQTIFYEKVNKMEQYSKFAHNNERKVLSSLIYS